MRTNGKEKIEEYLERCLDFTLVELLLVIAIIAILASLLLPALKRARERSKDILCISNEKQVMLTLINYSTDYEGYIPRYYRGDDNKGWYQLLTDIGYIPKPATINGNESFLICPSLYPFGKKLSGGYLYGMWVYNGVSHINLIKITPVRKIPIIADTIISFSDPRQWYHWRTDGTIKIIHCRHNSKAHVAFADGSVEAIGEDYFVDWEKKNNKVFYHVVNGVLKFWH